jgi:putative DNA primase/helicase
MKPPDVGAAVSLAQANPNENLADTVARLAMLPRLEYDQRRRAEAEQLGVRVSVLDDEVEAARQPGQEAAGQVAMFPSVEPHSSPVDGAALLSEIRNAVRRFIVCDDEIAVAVACWITFTWFIDRVQIAPLAIITAPEKRCGKSQLLNIIGSLSRRPLVASNISPAAVYRVIEAKSPTLIIDETDSFLRRNEEMRGIINSGHTRQSAFVVRTVGDDHEPQQFSTWGAKALAGIGKLADTLVDRGIVLELRRKLPSETAERLRHAPPELFETLKSKLARFADDAGAAIGSARPELPEELNDRAQDNWEPLLAISDHAGGVWPALARAAALKLSGEKNEAGSQSAELLSDIREVFETKRIPRITTADLITELTADDTKRWATYNRGKPISSRQLAKRLEQYHIKSKNMWIGGGAVNKGFELAQFDDAFARYLGAATNIPENAAMPLGKANIQGFRRGVTPAAPGPNRAGSPATAMRKPLESADHSGIAADSGSGEEQEGWEEVL